jgi:hypothetical protein
MHDEHEKEQRMKHPQGHTSKGDRSVTFAADYARVSTEDQGKGFSIPTQIEARETLAEREGYTVPEAYVLVDEGISGTTMDRGNPSQFRGVSLWVKWCTMQQTAPSYPECRGRRPGIFPYPWCKWRYGKQRWLPSAKLLP